MNDDVPVGRRVGACPCGGTVYAMVVLIERPTMSIRLAIGPDAKPKIESGRIASEAYCPSCRNMLAIRADYPSFDECLKKFKAIGSYSKCIDRAIDLFVEYHKLTEGGSG